eukprot:350980-Chlamydomonas_euryale.AAC.1
MGRMHAWPREGAYADMQVGAPEGQRHTKSRHRFPQHQLKYPPQPKCLSHPPASAHARAAAATAAAVAAVAGRAAAASAPAAQEGPLLAGQRKRDRPVIAVVLQGAGGVWGRGGEKKLFGVHTRMLVVIMVAG